MKAVIYAILGLAAAAAIAMAAPPAGAQTAADVNRLNQAIQICNSPMGAGMVECARLRGQLGGGAAKAAGAASLLGGVMGGGSAPSLAPAPRVGIDLNRAITTCVARATGNQPEIQRCLAIASGGTTARP